MVQQMVEVVGQSVSVKGKDLKSVREAISSRSYGLENYTVDEQGLKGFIVRIHREQSDNVVWFDNLLMFIGGRPSIKWTDANRVAAEYKLTSLMKKMRDLEKLRISFDGYKDGGQQVDADVYLLKSTKVGAAENDQVIVVDKDMRVAAAGIKKQLLDVIEGEKVNKELMLAALAEVVDDILFERNTKEPAGDSDKSKKMISVSGKGK